MIGDTARHGRKVRVSGGEKVEGNVRGEDFLGKRGGEKSGQARLESSES